MTLKLGVLVSGRGSNLQALLDAVAAGTLDAELRVVISNRAAAPALQRAQSAGVSSVVIEHAAYPEREAFDRELISELRRAGAEWVVLAGFMRLLTPTFITAFADRIINVHPSLLPAFPGLRAQSQALEYGVKVTGCSVHFVDQGTDTGAIIAQRALDVLPGESLESLEARLLKQEHALLVESLGLIASGKLRLLQQPGGRARVETK